MIPGLDLLFSGLVGVAGYALVRNFDWDWVSPRAWREEARILKLQAEPTYWVYAEGYCVNPHPARMEQAGRSFERLCKYIAQGTVTKFRAPLVTVELREVRTGKVVRSERVFNPNSLRPPPPAPVKAYSRQQLDELRDWMGFYKEHGYPPGPMPKAYR